MLVYFAQHYGESLLAPAPKNPPILQTAIPGRISITGR
jgi:hypothetical protein